MSENWETGQFVPADSPMLNNEALSLDEWLVRYLQGADEFLGFRPDYTLVLGSEPTYEVFTGKKDTPEGVRTYEILREAPVNPSPQAIAIQIRALCEAVAHARRDGKVDAAIVNGMRLEALAKQFEYARRIEAFARAGLKTARNLAAGSSQQRRQADSDVLDPFNAWQVKYAVPLRGKDLQTRVNTYLKKSDGSSLPRRQKARLRKLIDKSSTCALP